MTHIENFPPRKTCQTSLNSIQLSHEDVGYYGVDVYIPPKCMCWSPKLQYDSIWYGAFGRWFGLEGVMGLMMALLLFSR